MPYRIEWKDRTVRWIYTGIVTGKEALDSNYEVYSDNRFDDLRHEIVDFTNADGIDMSDQEVKKIAYMDKAATNSNPDIKVAMVGSPEMIKSISGMYAKYSENSRWKVAVFETLEEAEKWLGTAG